MITHVKLRKSLTLMSVIVVTIFLLTKCIDKQQEETGTIRNSGGEAFAGSEVCGNCHKSIHESHLTTAHFLTSQPVLSSNMKGSFAKDQNTFVLNERVRVVMEKRRDSFYQVAYLDGVERQASSMDIVVGSGTKGQTYLHWMQNGLFQLPISYFTLADQWTNSPGYPGMIVFNRPISSRCLECHSTYAEKISPPTSTSEEFDHDKIVFGVDCEKCHGPATKHVEFQSQNPSDTNGKFIINPRGLSRQQNLDLCALCHGGRLRKTRPSFTFQAGDKLSDYFSIDSTGRNTAEIDVHGNQYGLLAGSKCFLLSDMTCSSCHNVHQNEKGQLAVISKRCLNCHNIGQGKACKMNHRIGSVINENCIDCHMPKQTSRSITVFLQGSELPAAAVMRTHLIKIYPEETKKVLDSINLSNAIHAQ